MINDILTNLDAGWMKQLINNPKYAIS